MLDRNGQVLETHSLRASQIDKINSMKRISSRSTFFDKFIFPTAWFGFVGVFFVAVLHSGAAKRDPVALLVPIFMLIGGYLTMKHFVWDLVDQVFDEGNKLIVKNGSEEDLVLLENIMNVSSVTHSNPPRVTLRLINPCRFGREISFTPAGRSLFHPFAKNRIAEDLMVRVHRAKFPLPE
ncbi:MAG: hypothetical protein DWH91_01850 [Planctomycetota bacterium]|nr:MAG: hypothetical protein DWH91_01850 [Planctomycetota bacterium]